MVWQEEHKTNRTLGAQCNSTRHVAHLGVMHPEKWTGNLSVLGLGKITVQLSELEFEPQTLTGYGSLPVIPVLT